jgi:hypothetical protein
VLGINDRIGLDVSLGGGTETGEHAAESRPQHLRRGVYTARRL